MASWISSRLRNGDKIEDRLDRIEETLGNLVELLVNKQAISAEDAVSLLNNYMPSGITIEEKIAGK